MLDVDTLMAPLLRKRLGLLQRLLRLLREPVDVHAATLPGVRLLRTPRALKVNTVPRIASRYFGLRVRARQRVLLLNVSSFLFARGEVAVARMLARDLR